MFFGEILGELTADLSVEKRRACFCDQRAITFLAAAIALMRARMEESSHGSRFFVLKMMWRMTLLSDWGMETMMDQRGAEMNRAFSAGVGTARS